MTDPTASAADAPAGDEPDAAETVTAPRGGEDDAAETIVVDREPDAETIVVDRPDGSTVVVDRGAADGTVAVTRERPASTPALPRGRRRRGMTMPPVAAGYGRGAVDAVGPNAVATYAPRPIPAPPVDPAPLPGVEATRAEAPSMPSVQRRSRRAAIVTLALVAAACLVSVSGLVALGFALFG